MEHYFRAGLAPSTQRTYASAKKRFLDFCSRIHHEPLPLSEQILCRYVAFLAEQGLAPKSIKGYLSAARHLQISMHLPEPKMGDMARLEQVLKGTKKDHAKKSPGRAERLPITPELLLKMKRVWEKNPKDFDSVMMWAACCTCFFGFLRSGEISVPSEAAYDKGTHLNFADVSVDNRREPSDDKSEDKSI